MGTNSARRRAQGRAGVGQGVHLARPGVSIGEYVRTADLTAGPGPGGLPQLSDAEARWLRERVLDPTVSDWVVAKRAKVAADITRRPRLLLWRQALQAELEGEIGAMAGEDLSRLRSLVLARLAREACYCEDARVAALSAKVFLDHVPPPPTEALELEQLSSEALQARLQEIAGGLMSGEPEVQHSQQLTDGEPPVVECNILPEEVAGDRK